MIIENKDIVVYEVNTEHLCRDCFGDTKDEYIPLTADDFDEDSTVVCDDCGKVILVN